MLVQYITNKKSIIVQYIWICIFNTAYMHRSTCSLYTTPCYASVKEAIEAAAAVVEVAASEGLATIVAKPVIFREIAQLVAVVVVADNPVFVAPVIGAARRVIMRIPVVMAGVLTSAKVATDSAALLAAEEVA